MGGAWPVGGAGPAGTGVGMAEAASAVVRFPSSDDHEAGSFVFWPLRFFLIVMFHLD